MSEITDILTAMKVELISDGVKTKYVPDTDALTQCADLGRRVAEAVLKKPRSHAP